MRSTLKTTATTAAVVALFVAGLASVAEARTFRMQGSWIQQRGPNVQIPIFGGIPANNTVVSVTGTGTVDLTVPVNAFQGTGPPGLGKFVFPLPQTTLVQLSTMFSFNGPTAVGVMSGGAKGTRPANFAFCPGAAANPGCTTPQTGGAQGTQHGLVSYTAGPNQFGGTMQMLLGSNNSSLSAKIGISPIRIQHNIIGGGAPSPPPQVQGGSYANTNTAFLPGGPVTTGAVCSGGVCGAAGLITVPGVTTTPAGGGDSTNTRTGFPFTTGMVFVHATVQARPGGTTSSTSVTGSDMRTPLGAGQITLVAGGLSFRNPANLTFTATDTVTMTMTARNLPSISPGGMAALAGLLIAGAGYAARRRLNR